MLARFSHRQGTTRASAAGTIGFIVVPGRGSSVDILFGLIALIDLGTPRGTIGTVTRCGITLTIAAAAIGIALLITVLIATIGAITVTVAAIALALALAVTRRIAMAAIAAIGAIVTLIALAAIITSVALIGIDPILGHALDIAVEILVVALFERIVLAAAGLIFFEARARFGKHAEIMIGKLQIIFGVDAVTLHLGVARQRLVFLEQLGRIAACPIINAIAVFGTTPRIATTLRALPATTATAAGLTIVDQVLLSSCLRFKTGVAP